MALDVITAVGNAIAGVTGDIKPVIDEHYSQKYENEAKQRSNQWVDVLAQADDTRPDRIQSYVIRLLADAQTPVGGMGTDISVPLDCLNAFISIAIQYIKQQEQLANLQFKK